MTDHQNPKSTDNLPPPPSKISGSSSSSSTGSSSSGAPHFPNPPDRTNPDPATLREQWRFAIKQYSKWYSHAWGTAILAGLSFYALGWIIKGSNPLPSFKHEEAAVSKNDSSSSSLSSDDVGAVPEVKRS